MLTTTTGMPAPVVAAPAAPLVLLIASAVEPVAEPPLMINWSVDPAFGPPSAVFMAMFAPVPTYEPTVRVLKPPDGEKTIALLARLRLVAVDEALIVQFEPLAKDTLVMEVGSV